MTTHQPDSLEAIQDIVRTHRSITVKGGGSKLDASGDIVELTRWSGIDDYVPAECVFTARAGTPLRQIADALSRDGQYLPWDPPFTDEGATLGGAVASGLSGPRRYRYGGVRDFVIGVRVVDGEGRVIRSGGNVVKNAAGFLLHHAVVGSWGRFGVISEVTCKVFPAPETRRSLRVSCGSVEAAFRSARQIEGARVDCEAIDFDESGMLTVTVAGREAAMNVRLAKIERVLGGLTGKDAELSTSVPAFPTSVPVFPTSVPHNVKVPGLMKFWQKLSSHVDAAHFFCAGAIAWLSTSDPDALSDALRSVGLTGEIIRGPRAGDRIGHIVHNAFEERVRRVLDPHDKFSAASHSPR